MLRSGCISSAGNAGVKQTIRMGLTTRIEVDCAFGYSWIKNNLRSVRYVGGASLGFPKFGGRCGPGRL